MGTARLSQHIEEGQSTDEKMKKKNKGTVKSAHLCSDNYFLKQEEEEETASDLHSHSHNEIK